MTYETWVLVFLGMLTAMLLYNVVQWLWYQERVYGLYTAYMLVWLAYFILRNPSRTFALPDHVWLFLRTIGPMVAYFFYFEFTTAFLELKKWQPSLVRLFRYQQAGLLGYLLVEVIFCFATRLWIQPIHEFVHTGVRVALTVLSIYTIIRVYRHRNTVARLFITGSLMLVLGGLVAMLGSIFWLDYTRPDANWFWQAPLTYLHIGIFLELLCFSLGLAYRHRRESIRKALADKALAHEREQRLREQAEADLAVQQLKQEMTEMQMRALQIQISPHFLFNSLNTLSSLIADEPERAEVFVDEMSSVYRYLLRSNENQLTTLATEITFIHSYFHLLKTRYGPAIQLTVSVPEVYHACQLPPLTLQLLLENAVKHNIVSTEQPLHIRIAITETGALSVWNNRQPKVGNRSLSTKKGLLNITEKYRLLNQPSIQITETSDSFEVVVPLIASA